MSGRSRRNGARGASDSWFLRWLGKRRRSDRENFESIITIIDGLRLDHGGLGRGRYRCRAIVTVAVDFDDDPGARSRGKISCVLSCAATAGSLLCFKGSSCSIMRTSFLIFGSSISSLNHGVSVKPYNYEREAGAHIGS